MTQTHSHIANYDSDDGFCHVPPLVEAHARSILGPEVRSIFTTDAADLYDTAFVQGLPVEARQHYNCRACREFVSRYGGLVTIDPQTGTTTPIFWPDAASMPAFFHAAVRNVRAVVAKARVTGVFIADVPMLGTPKNTPIAGPHVGKTWHHFHARLPAHVVFKGSALQTAGQAMAVKAEEYAMLRRGLADFGVDTIKQAVNLLKSDALYRSDKCIGVAEWLLALQTRLGEEKAPSRRDNLAWLAVASAPVGYAHVRSGMIGTLLDDIKAGLDVPAIAARFAEKMNPLKYQRPQAAPMRGNLDDAERVVAKLGIAASLKRRYARLDDVLPFAMWRPPEVKAAEGAAGVFGHIKAKGEAAPANGGNLVPSSKMTWVKFAETVLPTARRIEYMTPTSFGHRGPYVALTTAVDPEAPPILQWDKPEARNPIAHYVYHSGSAASDWGLSGAHDVTAIVPRFGREAGVFIIVKGAKDSRPAHLCLFPETLKSELHAIRASIEAYSRAGTMEGREDASACGVALVADRNDWRVALVADRNDWQIGALRVTSADGTQRMITLDRWD